MAVTAVSNVGAVNLDGAVGVLTIPFVGASGQCIVVHVGIQSASGVVASVTDNFGNVYVKQSAVVARHEIDFPEEGLDKNPRFEDSVSGECWAVKSTGTISSIVVTLVTSRRFAVEIQSYTGSGLGATGFVALQANSAPTISVVTTGANSFISAGFSSVTGLNETVVAGDTIRGQEYSSGREGGIDVSVADATVTGLAACTVALAPSQQETLDGVTFGVPATYAICAVEVRS